MGLQAEYDLDVAAAAAARDIRKIKPRAIA
jgi:hypothetical protein